MVIDNVSAYSLISAIIYFHVGIIAITILRRNTAFLAKCSTSALLILLICSIARIFLPFDISNAFVIESKMIFPGILSILSMPVYSELTIWFILKTIWVVGIVIILLKAVKDFQVEIRKKDAYFTIEDEQINRISKEEIFQKAVIMISPDVTVPQVTGVFKAYIYLPPLSISDADLKMILMHEMLHFRGGDIFIKIFYILLKALFWWNPIVHIFQKEIYALLELRCDMNVTKKMSYEQRIKYLECILNVIKQTHFVKKINIQNVSTIANPNSEGDLQQRFRIIMNRDNFDSLKFKLRNLFLIITLFLSSYFFIIQPAYTPDTQEYIWKEKIFEDNGNFLVIYNENHIELYMNNTFIRNVSKNELERPPLSKYKMYKGED